MAELFIARRSPVGNAAVLEVGQQRAEGVATDRPIGDLECPVGPGSGGGRGEQLRPVGGQLVG